MTPRTRIDPRTVKTKERIFLTFRSMILEMDYQGITVTELTSRVGIHRKTFYLHYESIDSLFFELEDKIVEQINDIIIKSLADANTISFEMSKNVFMKFIETDSLLYKRLFFNESYQVVNTHVYDRITGLMTPYIKQTLRITDDEAMIVTNFILTGCFEVVRTCQRNNLSISADKLNRILLSLINTGISSINFEQSSLTGI